ncbi:MAG: DUF4923 family protein [Muribaculaceae bacterium]|nr:DUF4923 family protein [Muribaculaceae bacterium]
MKRICLFLIVGLIATSVNAQSLKDILNGVKNAGASTEQSSSTDKIGGLISGIANVLGKSNVEIADLEGTWKYNKPAVAFKSDNLLKKAGGTAAAEVIESKLAPYYQKAGMSNFTLTFNNDSTFTMKFNAASLSGTISKVSDSEFEFNFKALKKINIGKLNSVITKSGNTLNVTFDASKLITLVSKVASITGNSTIKSASSLLSSYDGLNAGFELSKQ